MKLERGAETKELDHGTVKVDRVVIRDLAFWVIHVKRHRRKGIPHMSTFEIL